MLGIADQIWCACGGLLDARSDHGHVSSAEAAIQSPHFADFRKQRVSAPTGVLTGPSSVVKNKPAPKVWSDHGCQDAQKPGEGWCIQLRGKI
jgi:hypothetical protein